MAENSTIEWTDHTWSPWIGCTKVSPACDGCYAEHLMDTRLGRVSWGPHGERSRTSADYWRKPLAWNKQAAKAGRMLRVFPSLCDPFDNRADPAVRREWFDLIRATPNLLWLILSKRPQNAVAMSEAAGGLPSNVALGTTCEDQKRAINLFHLAVAARSLLPRFTFASFEPLLGPVDPTRVVLHEGAAEFYGHPEAKAVRMLFDALRGAPSMDLPPLGWAITGGETDQGQHRARSTHPQWFRDIRDACAAANVPYLHKQNGEWLPDDPGNPVAFPNGWRAMRAHTERPAPRDELYPEAGAAFVSRVGKKAAGRLLDGVTHDGMPAGAGAGR